MELKNNLRRLGFELNEMSRQELADRMGVSINDHILHSSTLLALKIPKVFGKPVEDIFFIAESRDEQEENRL